ncbi:MAG: HEAT repeat domain-containing protein, partial [Vicinamibacteria bacterium]
ALDDRYEKIRLFALEELELFPLGREKLLAILERALDDWDKDIRYHALEKLTELHSNRIEMLPTYLHALTDRESLIVCTAAEHVGELEKEATDTIPLLLDRLEDGEIWCAEKIALILEKIAPGEGLAVPVLARILVGDEDSERREDAAQALAKLGALAVGALPALIQALEYEDEDTQGFAMVALANIGYDAAEAVPILESLLENNDPGIRWMAERTLWRISPEAAQSDLARVGMLAESLWSKISKYESAPDEPGEMLWDGAGLAGKGGEAVPDPAEEMPALTEALGNEDPRVRMEALRAIVGFQLEPESTVPTYAAMLEDEDGRVRGMAIGALSMQALQSEEAVDTLINRWRAGDEFTAYGAAVVLGILAEDKHPPVINRLRAALDDNDAQVRTMAALVLKGQAEDERIGIILAGEERPDEKILCPD